MMLPPEILDNILKFIPADREDRPTLVACALVATWWTGPSQRRLFSLVSITDKNFWRWMNDIVHPQPKTHLLRYVRSLTCYFGLEGIRCPMVLLLRDSGEHLSTLENLSLHEVTVYIEKKQLNSCFSGFRETLTSFSLRSVAMSFSMFVTVIGYFPNITTLRLGSFTLRPDERPVPPLPRPLRGRIYLYDIGSRWRFIDRLADLDLEYSGLIVQFHSSVVTEHFNRMLRLSEKTVKYLRLDLRFGREMAVDISDLRQLRELDLFTNWSGPTYKRFLSSITSAELHKIIFLVDPKLKWNSVLQDAETWGLIDKELCNLVARMGYRHKLEVELRSTRIGYDLKKYDSVELLPEFKKEGVVILRDDDFNCYL